MKINKIISSLLIFLLVSISFISVSRVPLAYGVDAIDNCLTDLSWKQNSTYASGTGWNMSVSGGVCTYIDTNPLEDGFLYSSNNRADPWTRDNAGANLPMNWALAPNTIQYVIYFEFNTTIIPDNANVTDTLMGINITSINDTFYFNNMTTRPSTGDPSTVANDTKAGTAYYTSNFGGGIEGAYEIDMDNADDELESQIELGINWFGVGVDTRTGVTWQYIRSEEDTWNNYPYLKVVFQDSSSDFGDLTLSSDNTVLFNGQTFTLTANFQYNSIARDSVLVAFQSSPDQSTWTTESTRATDSLGNSQIVTSQDVAGTWYYRAYMDNDPTYGTETSNTITMTINQMPGGNGDTTTTTTTNGENGGGIPPIDCIVNPLSCTIEEVLIAWIAWGLLLLLLVLLFLLILSSRKKKRGKSRKNG
jgi:hypothetical protein